MSPSDNSLRRFKGFPRGPSSDDISPQRDARRVRVRVRLQRGCWKWNGIDSGFFLSWARVACWNTSLLITVCGLTVCGLNLPVGLFRRRAGLVRSIHRDLRHSGARGHSRHQLLLHLDDAFGPEQVPSLLPNGSHPAALRLSLSSPLSGSLDDVRPFFLQVPVESINTLAIAQVMSKMGWRQCAILYCDEQYGRSNYDGFIGHAAQVGPHTQHRQSKSSPIHSHS